MRMQVMRMRKSPEWMKPSVSAWQVAHLTNHLTPESKGSTDIDQSLEGTGLT